MLLYRGAIPQVHAQLDYVRPLAEDAMRSLFGDRYDELEHESSRLLVPQAFVDSAGSAEDPRGVDAPLKDDDSLFRCFLDKRSVDGMDVSYDGNVTAAETCALRTSPAISMAPSGIANKYSMMGRNRGLAPFASYLHEFVHFSNYCLQHFPMSLANAVLFMSMRKNGLTAQSLDDYEHVLDDMSANPDLVLPMSFFSDMRYAEEAYTLAIEGEILRRMGVDDTCELFGAYVGRNEKEKAEMKNIAESLKDGDFSAVHRWHEKTEPDRPYRTNFRATVSEIGVERVPIEELWSW